MTVTNNLTISIKEKELKELTDEYNSLKETLASFNNSTSTLIPKVKGTLAFNPGPNVLFNFISDTEMKVRKDIVNSDRAQAWTGITYNRNEVQSWLENNVIPAYNETYKFDTVERTLNYGSTGRPGHVLTSSKLQEVTGNTTYSAIRYGKFVIMDNGDFLIFDGVLDRVILADVWQSTVRDEYLNFVDNNLSSKPLNIQTAIKADIQKLVDAVDADPGNVPIPLQWRYAIPEVLEMLENGIAVEDIDWSTVYFTWDNKTRWFKDILDF